MTNNLLDIGDVVYRLYGELIAERFPISRVTPAMAFFKFRSEELKLKRKVHEDGSIDGVGVGQNSWLQERFYISTPELIEQFKKQRMSKILLATQWSKYTSDQLAQVMSLVDSFPKPEMNK